MRNNSLVEMRTRLDALASFEFAREAEDSFVPDSLIDSHECARELSPFRRRLGTAKLLRGEAWRGPAHWPATVTNPYVGPSAAR